MILYRIQYYPRYSIGIIWYYIGFNTIRDILLDLYDTISDSILFAISYWDSYDTISVLISIRDILLELYDTISDAISIRDILLDSYDTISVSISIRDILLDLYDTISDSISIRDILLDLYDTISDSILSAISYWIYMILYQIQYYSRYPIEIIWYYIGFNTIRDILLDLYDTISDSILFAISYWDSYDTISDTILFAIFYWIYMILYQIQYYSRYLIGFIWYYIGFNKYPRYLIGFIWYYIGFNKYPRYPIGFIWYYIGLNKYSRYPIGFIWYYIGFNTIRDILLDLYDTISDSILFAISYWIYMIRYRIQWVSAICSPFSMNGIHMILYQSQWDTWHFFWNFAFDCFAL